MPPAQRYHICNRWIDREIPPWAALFESPYHLKSTEIDRYPENIGLTQGQCKKGIYEHSFRVSGVKTTKGKEHNLSGKDVGIIEGVEEEKGWKETDV